MSTTKPRKKRTPKLRKRVDGRAVVTIDGRDIYLGQYGTSAAEEAYHRLIAEWKANGCRMPVQSDDRPTVAELTVAYRKHAAQHYRHRDGTPTSRMASIDVVITDVVNLYGSVDVDEFGAQALRAVRQVWIDRGLSVGTINSHAGTVRRMFKWGVEHKMVKAWTLEEIKAVSGLSVGRSEAKDTEPVKPVPEEHVAAVKPYVSDQVWALVELQRLTGARPGELVRLRPCDIERAGKVWSAALDDHKTAYRGRRRVLFFGPKAKRVLKPWLKRSPHKYLFSPREAEAARRAAEAEGSRREDQKPNPRKTGRVVGDHYTATSYRRAIHRACDKADIPRWSPHALRHNAATAIRRDYGLEAAQVVLGHASAEITQVYAERDEAKAKDVIAKIG